MRTRLGSLGFAALGVAASMGLLAGNASAGPILFDTTLTGIQQTDNRPCVIGDQSCNKPAGWNYEAVSGTPGGPGNGTTYNLLSPTYLVIAGNNLNNTAGEDQISANFQILIDENIAAGQPAEVLEAFRTYDCGTSTVVANGANISGSGNPGGPIPAGCSIDAANSFIGPQTVPNVNNGNGFSDVGLTGFNLIIGHHYLFQAIVSSDTDGMEQFFINPLNGGTVVPEPASILLLGTGLIGAASRLRRLRRK